MMFFPFSISTESCLSRHPRLSSLQSLGDEIRYQFKNSENRFVVQRTYEGLSGDVCQK
jgi:hypothetical protein